jgi:hypothetical protein
VAVTTNESEIGVQVRLDGLLYITSIRFGANSLELYKACLHSFTLDRLKASKRSFSESRHSLAHAIAQRQLGLVLLVQSFTY